MTKAMPAWTVSSIGSFMSCPHKYYRLRVLRDVKDFPPTEQITWGNRLHKAFEDAVKYDEPLAKEYEQYSTFLDKIRAIKGEKFTEYSFSLDENFQPCAWGEAWVRGKADLVIKLGKEVLIFDYKTGKRKTSDPDQLSLYAAFAFAYWSEVETVHTCYVWLKDKKLDKHTYKRDDNAGIWQDWLPLVRRMTRAYESDKWDKNNTGLCRNYCPVKDCQFCGS